VAHAYNSSTQEDPKLEVSPDYNLGGREGERKGRRKKGNCTKRVCLQLNYSKKPFSNLKINTLPISTQHNFHVRKGN
jgi:hypothetical protein